MATDEFHQAARGWAQIKHSLLTKYLNLFVGKVGSQHDRVHYVDAFAGPGQLEDGTKGSALYAAEQAAKPLHRTRQNVLKCINIEADPNTFKMLEAATAAYVDGGHVKNFPGRFDERREEVLRIIGGSPALFFIDPFGTDGAELSTLKALKRTGAIREALVRYDDTRVKRLARWSANHLESLDPRARKTAEAFKARTNQLTGEAAITAWLDGEPDARSALIDGYINEARRLGIFKYGIAYPIRNPDTRGHRYFLVHLCDFPDGYTWMANFMAAAEIEYEELREQRTLPLGQSTLFSVREMFKTAREAKVTEISSRLYEICIRKRWGKEVPVQCRYVYAALVDEFQWQASRSEWEQALKKLQSDGGVHLTGVKDNDTCTFNLVP